MINSHHSHHIRHSRLRHPRRSQLRELSAKDVEYARGLVILILGNYRIDSGSPLWDECFSIANLALVRALCHYDKTKGAAWKTYMHMRVTSAVKTLLRNELTGNSLGMVRVGKPFEQIPRFALYDLTLSEDFEPEIVNRATLEQIYRDAEKILKTNTYLMFVFRFREGYTVSEIARMFHVSHSSICYHLKRAVVKLKRRFNPEHDADTAAIK